MPAAAEETVQFESIQIEGYFVAAVKAKCGYRQLAAYRAGKPSEQKFGLRSGR
jgi:hypothetical protein